MPDETSEVPPAPRANGETPKVPEEPMVPPAEDWATRYKYLLADFDNFRRRVERDRESISRQARAALVRELLPIIEAFRTARDSLAHLPVSDPVRKGLDLLDREWTTFLKREGVEPVAIVGRPFRAEEAEAIGEAPATAAHPDGSVAEVVQQGYRFFGGLLRPAKVFVARSTAGKTPKDSVEPEASAQE
ncbi:MAG: nucleotide exchange factor GrpE [Thermoplasmata archaeon]|nr:nucleotide exchange factor GrpE [Thermoplasmata archaeon]